MAGAQAEVCSLQGHVAPIDAQIALLIFEIVIDLVQRGPQFADLLASLSQDPVQQTFRSPYHLALPQQVALDVVVNEVDPQSALPTTTTNNFRRKWFGTGSLQTVNGSTTWRRGSPRRSPERFVSRISARPRAAPRTRRGRRSPERSPALPTPAPAYETRRR